MAETISRDGPARRAAPPRTASLTLPHRYAAEGIVESSADALFSRLDDHARLSAHMEKPSWMMLGARMRLELDAGRGRAVGARIRLRGRVFGIPLFVEEEVDLRLVEVGDAGVAHRREDAAEVRIAGEERRLDQRRVGDAERDAVRAVIRCRSADPDCDEF